jgi:hypothetical protein
VRARVEQRWAAAETAVEAYDEGRRMACGTLLCGPVRALAAERFVELALVGRDESED